MCQCVLLLSGFVIFFIAENNKRKNSFQSSDMAETGPLLSLACVGQVAEVWEIHQIQLYP